MHTGAHFLSQTDSQGIVKQTIWLQTSSEKRMVCHSYGGVLGPPWAGPPIGNHRFRYNCLPKWRFRRSCCRAFGRRPPWSSLISLRKLSGNYPATIRPLSGQNHVFPLYPHRLETLTYQTLLFYCIYNGFGDWGSPYQASLLYLQWFPNLVVSKSNFSIVSQ